MRSSDSPRRQCSRITEAVSTWSRSDKGSPPRPTRDSRAEVTPLTRSVVASGSFSGFQPSGAPNAGKMSSGAAEPAPGVSNCHDTPSRTARRSSGPRPDPSSPLRQNSAWSAATFDRSSSSTASGGSHGAKSSPASEGKLRRRFTMSPLRSITKSETPRRASSSSVTMPRPVFPDPVIPRQTAWVVRWSISRWTRSDPSSSVPR